MAIQQVYGGGTCVCAGAVALQVVAVKRVDRLKEIEIWHFQNRASLCRAPIKAFLTAPSMRPVEGGCG